MLQYYFINYKLFIKMYYLDPIEEVYQNKISKIITFLFIFILLLFTIRPNIHISLNKNKIRKTNDIFNSNKIFIESHHGVNKDFFENTLESFSKAIENDIDCLELDVWLTKDKVLTIVHKGEWENLKKYYGISKPITNLTWKQLSEYKSIKYNLKIPRLEEIMEITKNKILINLEIKDPRIDLTFPYIINLIEKYEFYEQIFLTSFYYKYYNKTVEYNKKTGKNIPFQFAYHKIESEFDFSKEGNIISIYWKNITKEICNKAHANGMAISASLRFDNENINVYKKIF